MTDTSQNISIPTEKYVKVILPIFVPTIYTYRVNEIDHDKIEIGKRVEVELGRTKRYSGVIIDIEDTCHPSIKPKEVISFIDDEPIVSKLHIDFWLWIANYYLSTPGLVMNAALPANLKLTSETILTLHPNFDENQELNDQEFLIAEALTIQSEITLDDAKSILDQKVVYRLINQLLSKEIIQLKGNLKQKYKAKLTSYIRFTSEFSMENNRKKAFELTKKSMNQSNVILALFQMDKSKKLVTAKEIREKVNVTTAVLKALEKKGIIELFVEKESRVDKSDEFLDDPNQIFSDAQKLAFEKVKEQFETKNTVLLHGVTGSGKTRIYIELIKETLEKGGQILYLLPEIALTSQIISRLRKVFGKDIMVYHSKVNDNTRVESWTAVYNGHPIVISARSGLFLPFNNLQLIIVDEEHDSSFKQIDPAPRYNARDSAIYLAHLAGAKTLLGTATPAVTTYFNARSGKFGLVELMERFGGVELPKITIVDKKRAYKMREIQAGFTNELIEGIQEALSNDKQVILFQNRRGYAPTLQCVHCGWNKQCKNCDVSLTYHKFFDKLQCHYCGYYDKVLDKCPSCEGDLSLKGTGTEKIVEDLELILPEAKIKRMDLDTVRKKNALQNLIKDFEDKKIDILVGTQMVTKGLDFDDVVLVGVLNADQSLHFPTYDAGEKAFQLFTQVSGRSGRKGKQGNVLIQAIDSKNQVLKYVVEKDYQSHYLFEIQQRLAFDYPPYSKLIKITLKHTKPKVVNSAAKWFHHELIKGVNGTVLGPAAPFVGRVRNYYLVDFIIKLEKNNNKIFSAKKTINKLTLSLKSQPGWSGVRVNVNVDP